MEEGGMVPGEESHKHTRYIYWKAEFTIIRKYLGKADQKEFWGTRETQVRNISLPLQLGCGKTCPEIRKEIELKKKMVLQKMWNNKKESDAP